MLVHSALKQCASTFARRSNSSLAPLPPLEEWKAAFPTLFNTSRYYLKDQTIGDELAKAFIDNKRVSKEPKIVIEAFPGLLTLQYGIPATNYFLRPWCLDAWVA